MTSNLLKETNDFLGSLVKTDGKPSNLESVYYTLSKEFGFTQEDINNQQIPYLLSLLKTFHYIKKLEEKSLKKRK